MSSLDNKIGVGFGPGVQVPVPKGPGSFIAKPFRTEVCTILQCLLNPNIKVIIANSGVSPTTIDAEITMDQNGWTAEINLTGVGSGGIANGGFQGEYDQTKSYSAGQTFLISTATLISGIAVIAGFYGVPPGGNDVNGLPWAGNVPANPTGNAVPQSPLPSLGAAPNDKFYAKLIMPSC